MRPIASPYIGSWLTWNEIATNGFDATAWLSS